MSMMSMPFPCVPFLCLLAGGFLQAQTDRTPLTPLPPAAGETSALVEEIQRAEYRLNAVKGEEGVWSAPNRAHELRSRVSERGLEVFPRTTSADGLGAVWTLSLVTTSFGRVDGAFDLPRATVSVTGERVELDHGYLVEWFVNDERGLEQGWTIAERPIGSESVVLGLSIAGELELRIDEGGRSGVFVDGCGEAVLRYRDLAAFDATGREFAARLVPAAAGVAIEVDDAGAVYPLTVDPLLTSPAWTAESNQPGALFGVSVSSAGDVNGDGYSDVIVGAQLFDAGEADEGRAYVFHGSASGLSASASWVTDIDVIGATFGFAVATAGDVNGDGYSDVIVGAANASRAYVYHGSSGGLGASPAWFADANDTSILGHSVSTAGDVNGDGYSDVIIGAPSYANGQSGEGRAVVYMGSASGLSASSAWSAESNQADAQYGWSVCTAGDVNGDGYSDVIVGAYQFDAGQTNEGRAYVYHGSPAGLSASASWTAESNLTNSYFATSVSTAGDVNGDGYSDVIVGAPVYTNGESNEGRAYVYHGSPSGLSAGPAWAVESNLAATSFGFSVSTAGDVNGDGYSDVIVGAGRYDGGETDEGRAYAYQGSATGLAIAPAWTAESNQANAFFGNAVATAGDVNGDGYADVLVGAYFYDAGSLDEGRAYAYHGSSSGLAVSSAWSAEADHAGALFGTSVSTAGDVNGDGYSDVIVGAYLYDNGQSDEGRVFVYHGSSSGLPASSNWSAESDQANAFFGISVSTAGDVNGDGYSDVIVGAYLYDNGQVDEGRAYVFEGSSSGLGASPAWTVESDQAGAWLGDSVSTAGDVNGDGYSDVIVGAPGHDNGQADEGRAHVYHGSASGLAASPAWMAESNQAGALFGEAVSSAGDVNGDGYSDVIVGASSHDNGEANEGRASVYHGSASGLAAGPAWTAEPNQLDARFGVAVSTAGDVNGDGYSDVLVGAYLYDDGEVDEGGAFLYQGSSNGLAASPAWTAESDQAGARFGWVLSDAGDVNGDGYSDVLVGAILYDGGAGQDEGRAYAYLGSASGLAANAAWTGDSGQQNSLFGHVGGAGDVNGDGYSDVIVGAPYYDNGQGDEGRVRVWLGNAGLGGVVHRLQQRTSNDLRPLSVLGTTGRLGLFHIRCEFSKKASGWSWAMPLPTAHLEWEVKPLGVAFDGAGIQRGADQSLLPFGGTLTFDELASIDDAAGHALATEARSYRWRARVATNSSVFPNTAWFSAPGSNVTEAKLRKPALQFP